MSWKRRIGLGVATVLALALVYPGLPAGVNMVTNSSPTEATTRMTCYSLHWNGVHSKNIVIHHELNRPINVSDAACWRPSL